jgi:hypothetical protein
VSNADSFNADSSVAQAPALRAFKTAWFSKACKKAHISDSELSDAVREVLLGQADDLGGGVFKKRLKKNRYRSLILTKGEHYWVFEFLFAKADRDNIQTDELQAFRKLAKSYALLTPQQLQALLNAQHLYELAL